MKKLTIKELLWASNGTFYGNPCVLEQEVTNHAYMLNQLEIGGAYYIYQEDDELAMISLKSAINKGAMVCITDKDICDNVSGTIIKVEDMLEATKAIGRYARQFIDIPIIAVTGSVGKTSTKDMIASVLEQKYKVSKTSPYWNSNYRIAFCILNIKEDDEVIVIESAVGNMNDNIENGRIICPDIVCMTNIGDSHMDSFKTKENILEAKRRLIDYSASTGTVFLNYNDPYIKSVYVKKPKEIVSIGYNNSVDVFAVNVKDNVLDGVSCTLISGTNSLDVSIPVPGVHFVDSALFAYGIGLRFGIGLQDIKKGIEHYETSDHRCKIINTKTVTILEDCYNTSPKSSKSALDILSNCEGRKCVIFGAMNRLGDTSEHYHREIGEYIYSKKIDVVIAIGEDTKYLIDQLTILKYEGIKYHYLNKYELKNELKNIIKPNDYILIKGALPDNFAEITEWLNDF